MSAPLEIDSDDFLDAAIMSNHYPEHFVDEQGDPGEFPSQEAEFKTVEEGAPDSFGVGAPPQLARTAADWADSDDEEEIEEAEILSLAGTSEASSPVSITTKKYSWEFKPPSKRAWLKAKPKSHRLVARHNAAAFEKVKAKRAENPPKEDFLASILASMDAVYAKLPAEKPVEVAPAVTKVTAPAFGQPAGEVEIAALKDLMKRLREDEQARGGAKRARLFVDLCACA